MDLGRLMQKHQILDLGPTCKWNNLIYFNFYSELMVKGG